MKVPDKIYIHPNYEPSGGWITTETREYQPDDVWETEYIRKEALLEWLKSERKKCESRDVELWQRINAFTDVIEKIESL